MAAPRSPALYPSHEAISTCAAFSVRATCQRPACSGHRASAGFHERDPRDPRISHALTLDTDDYGQYSHALHRDCLSGWRRSSLSPQARAEQARSLATCIEQHLPLDTIPMTGATR